MLILWIGVSGCVVFYAVCLFISALELLGIKLASSRPALGEGHLFNEFKEGVRYVGATPMILASTVVAYVISVFVGTYPRFLHVFAKDILQVGPDGLGLLVAAPGIGALQDR